MYFLQQQVQPQASIPSSFRPTPEATMLTINFAAHHTFYPPPHKPRKHLDKLKNVAPSLTNSSITENPLILSSCHSQKRDNFVVGDVTENQRDRATADREFDGETERRKQKATNGPQNYKGLDSDPPSPSLESSASSASITRGINAGIVLAAGTFAITKLLTIDHDYWHGWTLYEILRYAPEHNWIAYEEALKENPVLAKMVISGIVYSLGDWIAQCYEGKPLFDFDLTRMLRSGLVGFTLHGSLSHYYYQFCEALFPFQGWWVVPAKVAFDQTAWAAVWNSIYYVALGFLRLESPNNIFRELTGTFWAMLTAGWKLWPFAHLITYGVIPVEQRLLWVDCVELIWVTILSTYSNEKSEARITEAQEDANFKSTLRD